MGKNIKKEMIKKIVIGVAWIMCLLPPQPILSGQSQMRKTRLGKGLWGEGGERGSQKK